MPPIVAAENHPVRVCSASSVAERSWIAVWTHADKTRACGIGSIAVWNGASTQVQLVETIDAAPTSAVKSKTKLSISPTSIGSNGIARRMVGFLRPLSGLEEGQLIGIHGRNGTAFCSNIDRISPPTPLQGALGPCVANTKSRSA